MDNLAALGFFPTPFVESLWPSKQLYHMELIMSKW